MWKFWKTFKEYYELLSKRLEYLKKLLFDFKMKLSMWNKERGLFQYKSGDVVYIISLLTSQLQTISRKVSMKFVEPVAGYKNIYPNSFLPMYIGWKIIIRMFWIWQIEVGSNMNYSS